MKKVDSPYEIEDCKRIVLELEKLGYIATLTEAHTLWELISGDYYAGWLNLDEDSLQKQLKEGLDNFGGQIYLSSR